MRTQTQLLLLLSLCIPFARAVAAGAEDDSFDSLDGDAPEEETVFGARHVKRGAAPLGT
jgi:hypothetical protein